MGNNRLIPESAAPPLTLTRTSDYDSDVVLSTGC